MEGSRSNIHIPKDDFQDYDIKFLVDTMEPFLKDDDWLEVFGPRIMMQKPEDMELFPAEEPGFSYLMMFDDDVKMDLSLRPVAELEEYLKEDQLVTVLLDKDGRIEKWPTPTDAEFHIQKPTARMFDDCCNEFWNVTPYVVKGLCRKEILFAADHLYNVQRQELLKMISWKVAQKYGYDFSLGKNYKFLDQYVAKSLWERLLSTYNMGSYEQMWKALYESMALFREVSKEVANTMGYTYPPYDAAISAYVERHSEASHEQ